MSYADDVRDHCRRTYIDPARQRGEGCVGIRAGNVHKDLKYSNRYSYHSDFPGIKKSVLESPSTIDLADFQEALRVFRMVERTGVKNSACRWMAWENGGHDASGHGLSIG
jgi:hypothetical protein